MRRDAFGRAAEALSGGQITGHSLAAWSESVSLEELKGARDVVFASERPEDRPKLVELLERSLENDFELWVLPGLADIVSSRAVTKSLADLPLTPVATRGASLFAFAWRRALDILFGTLLSWMQDHRAPIFLIATANNLAQPAPCMVRPVLRRAQPLAVVAGHLVGSDGSCSAPRAERQRLRGRWPRLRSDRSRTRENRMFPSIS